MNIYRCLYAIAFGFLAALTTPLLAGVASIEVTSDDSGERSAMQLEYREGGTVRMNVPQQPGGYLLVKDGVAYSVSSQDGQDMVMRLDALQGLGRMMPAPSPAKDLAEVRELSPTGRQETVAGIAGEVWSIRYTDDEGRSQQSEVVLSDDPRALALTDAMNMLSSAMVSALGQQAKADNGLDRQLSGKGFLRFGQSMRVTEINGERPPVSRFRLPSKPVAMPQGGGLTDSIGELFGSKTERQQNRVEDRIEQEADDSLDEKVKGFLDNVF